VAGGHAIGRIASLGDDELQSLLSVPSSAPGPSPRPDRPVLDTTRFRDAIQGFDNAALDLEFARLAVMLPPLDLVRDVLLPRLREAGETWHVHPGGIAHEHLMSATMRHMLGAFVRLYTSAGTARRLLFATPSGDRHEIGILGGAMLAASRGFAVTYLGPDLPASEIRAALAGSRAQVLVLGLTLAEHDAARERELTTLVQQMPGDVELWCGGAGTVTYAAALSPRAVILETFDAYLEQLTRLAARGGPIGEPTP